MIQRQWLWLQFSRVFSRVFPYLAQSCLRKGLAVSLMMAMMLPLVLFSSSVSAAPLRVLPITPSSPPTLASIHTYNEKPGQTTLRSKQSLRDRSDRSWQVILFKRYQANDLQGLYLRLVGFPGIVSLDTQKPITIATGASAQWQAQPALDPQTSFLPDNASQYDVATAIADLGGDIPLQINIPLGGGSTAQLVVPPFAVHEWRALNELTPT